MELLRVSGVSKKEKNIFTVKDISFEQQPFQKIVIAGETGSGKTTLLKMIGGLAQPDNGEIWFEQKKVRGPFDQLIPGHAGIAYLSQHFELRNNYWVHEILSYANELPPARADEIYAVCRIEQLLNRRTDQLSGGERQRIALARLLIGSPRLLLLDEPFSNLDVRHRDIIRSVINDVNAALGISCIMVSHDAADVLSWADTILVLKEGLLIQQDKPETIYYKPVNEYCAGLFGEYNLVDPNTVYAMEIADVPMIHGKRMLIRPEQLTINSSGDGLKAIVKNKWFMGSFRVVELVANKQVLKVKTTETSFDTGDEVYVSLKDTTAWFV